MRSIASTGRLLAAPRSWAKHTHSRPQPAVPASPTSFKPTKPQSQSQAFKLMKPQTCTSPSSAPKPFRSSVNFTNRGPSIASSCTASSFTSSAGSGVSSRGEGIWQFCRVHLPAFALYQLVFEGLLTGAFAWAFYIQTWTPAQVERCLVAWHYPFLHTMQLKRVEEDKQKNNSNDENNNKREQEGLVGMPSWFGPHLPISERAWTAVVAAHHLANGLLPLQILVLGYAYGPTRRAMARLRSGNASRCAKVSNSSPWAKRFGLRGIF